MKGLLIKDLYTLAKQLKIFILMIIVFSFMPQFSASGFAVIYSAMLPISALAYDERSKWNYLAVMMPYSAKDVVICKYLLGYIMLFAAALLSAAAQICFSMLGKAPVSAETFIQLLLIVCIAVIFQAVNLPFMFKMGVEKGRLVFFALIAILVLGGTAFGSKLIGWLSSIRIDMLPLSIGVLFLTFLVNAISIAVSINIYKRVEL